MSLKDAYELFAEAKKETLAWFTKEIAQLRTGRARPDLVSHLFVEHYGARTPLQGLAAITSADARTIVISPWDPGVLPSIEKAITAAALGVLPIADGKVIRLSFPSLTEELREQTVRALHRQAEEARARLRQARDGALDVLRADRKSSAITDDDFYDGRKKLDDMINETNDEIEALIRKKEEEIRTV